MNARGHGDCCPACGSDEVQPYAIILGAAEVYGYQCLTCSVTWPVLQSGTMPDTLPDALAPARGVKGPAV
jgi:hypothetical protein